MRITKEHKGKHLLVYWPEDDKGANHPRSVAVERFNSTGEYVQILGLWFRCSAVEVIEEL